MKLVIPKIEHRIFTIRGMQVMLDGDLAELYQVETKVLNQAVKRNTNRFPDSFCFRLTDKDLKNIISQRLDLKIEAESSRSQFVTLNSKRGKNIKYLPFAFTEQGVAMLSAVLRSKVAIQVSLEIMKAFVAMRKTLNNLHLVLQRLDTVEVRQLKTDATLEKVLKALEKDTTPRQGIFYEGQLFDATVFVSKLIKQSKKSIASTPVKETETEAEFRGSLL
jgi:hypothetical protein